MIRFEQFYIFALVGMAFLMPNVMLAQNKVMGQPVPFEEPLDQPNEREQRRFEQCSDCKKSKKEAWIVVSDRDYNTVYAKPSFTAEKVREISFREYYYVVDEEPDWVQIAKAETNGLKITKNEGVLGWVPKSKMLLWTSSLLSPLTKINQKVCLLNRADASQDITNLEKVDISRGPGDRVYNKEPELNIYSFYFILKKEGDRYLIADEDKVNRLYINKIIGWVNKRRCAEWNTRLALEPNFEEAAFKERQSNPDWRVRGYQDAEPAKDLAKSGKLGSGRVLWSQDPASGRKGKYAVSNPMRYQGSFLRFPILAAQGAMLEQNYFRTGVRGAIRVIREGNKIRYGEIEEDDWGWVMEERNRINKKSKNFNVCFLVEGSPVMGTYRNAIAEAMREIQSEYQSKLNPEGSIDFALSIYRGPYEKDVPVNNVMTDKRFEYEPLTSDIDKVIGFLNNAQFNSWKDNLDYKALYYGVHQSLKKVNFNKDETNVLVLVGNFGDYRADDATNTRLKNDETRVKGSDVVEKLADLNVHFYAIQCANDNREETLWFGKHAHYLMEQAAKTGYVNSYGKKGDATAAEIKKLFDFGSEDVSVAYEDADLDIALPIKSLWPGHIIKPNGKLGTVDIQKRLVDFFEESYERLRKFSVTLDTKVVRGDSVSVKQPEYDEFNTDMAKFLYDLAKKEGDGVPLESVKLLTGQKVQLYAEIYFPRKIEQAKYSMFLHVLFMPREDLLRYQSVIRSKINTKATVSEMRDNLEQIYWELIVQFTGNEGLKEKFQKMSVSDVVAVMQGVYGEGLELKIPIDVQIKDLKNERATPDSTIQKLYERFREVDQHLEEIIRKNERYEFMYRSPAGRDYYWIPVGEAF